MSFRLRDNEKLIIDVARTKGNLTLSDIAEVWDLNLDPQNRNRVFRKIRRLLDLEILEATETEIKYVNKRKYPESCFKIQFQAELI